MRTRPLSAARGSLSACALALGFTASLVSTSAHAQTAEELALRRITLDQARAAATAGRIEDALDLAQRAAAIQSTPSVSLFIAVQQSALHHYADALVTAHACVREAELNTQLANREAIMLECRRLVTVARAFTGTVSLRLPSPLPPGLRVRVQGVERSSALRSLPIPVDVGEVRVDARDDEGGEFSTVLRVRATEDAQVTVLLVRRASPRAPRAVVGPARPAPGVGLGPVLLGVTAGVAGVTSLVLVLARDASVSDCVRGVQDGEPVLNCPANDDALDRAATPLTLQTASAVALGVGVAALVTGGVWLGVRLGSRPVETAASRGRVRVVLTPTGAGLAGSF